MFAQLGDVPFELLNSFTDLEETHEAQFAKHEVLQGRPRLQAMGNALTELKFGIRLHWRLGDVDAAYKGLVAAKEAQQAVSLVYGSGRFAGWFVIERLAARTRMMDQHGRTETADVAKHAVRVNIPVLDNLQTIIARMFITIFAIELLSRRPSFCTIPVSYCYDQGYSVTQYKYK